MQPLLPSPDLTQPVYDIYADTTHLDSVLAERPFPAYSSANTTFSGPTVTATSAVSSQYTNVTVPLSQGFDIPAVTGPDIAFPTAPSVPPYSPHIPLAPPQAIYIHGTDFYLVPNYVFFPKRRKRVPYSFADGFVAAW